MALRELLNDQAGNKRRGQHYRTVQRGGQTVHDYATGPDIAVGPHAVADAGQGHAPQTFDSRDPGPPAAMAAQQHAPATSLADLIAGQQQYEQHGGQGGPVLGGHMHDAAGPDAGVGQNAQGQQFSRIKVGGRDFHVYFSPDGTRMVREIKRPPTFTPTPQ